MKHRFAAAAIALLAACAVLSCAQKTPEEKLQDAAEALKKRDPLGAIVLAREVLRDHTTGTIALQARWLLYQCYAVDRNPRECNRILDEIIAQTGFGSPHGQQAALQRVQTFAAMRQTTAALEQANAFLEVKDIQPGSPFWLNLMFMRAELLLQLDQVTTAQKALASILRTWDAPENARKDALDQLENTYATTQSAATGIEFFQTHLADEPSTTIRPEVYRVMGRLAALLKDKEREEAFYGKCFEHYERMYQEAAGAEAKIAVLRHYAGARHMKGDIEGSAALLKKGLAEFPTASSRIDLYYQLASLYGFNGRFDEAIEVCRTIPQEFPNDPRRVRAYFMIAECHLQQKKYDAAIGDCREIIALFPGQAPAQEATRAIRMIEALRRQEAETSATLAASQSTTGVLQVGGRTMLTTAPAQAAPVPSGQPAAPSTGPAALPATGPVPTPSATPAPAATPASAPKTGASAPGAPPAP
ncbi:MAG: tetratricopeptide repeat protein [Candidatus Sumerlaeia bacterium]|nr:tetratricopeptide repeat protein [Candidatus Sumerlaeia bacterium]